MFNSIFIIIGTIIGAGFASGKEIFTFFNVYGMYGFIGLIISELIIGLVIYRTFKIVLENDISSYSQFVNFIFTKSPFLSNVMCNVINIFLLISFIVMCAGFSGYFAQEFNVSPFYGSIIISFLCFIVFLKNIELIGKINKVIIPFLLFIIVFLGFKNLDSFINVEFHFSTYKYNWVISSILYASYNLIVLFPIIISLKKYVNSIRVAKIISVFVVLFLSIMSIILFFVLNKYFVQIIYVDLPTVFIVRKLGTVYKYCCGLAILGAIFTTAVSSGYAFLHNLNIKNTKVYLCINLCMCIASIFLSRLGFANLLNLLYPILGVVGLVEIAFLFCSKDSVSSIS